MNLTATLHIRDPLVSTILFRDSPDVGLIRVEFQGAVLMTTRDDGESTSFARGYSRLHPSDEVRVTTVTRAGEDTVRYLRGKGRNLGITKWWD